MKMDKPFGSKRSSMSGANAIAKPSRMFEPQPQQGIGSLPSPGPTVLAGGLGAVARPGESIDYAMNLIQPKKGLRPSDLAKHNLALDYSSLRSSVRNKKVMMKPNEWVNRDRFLKNSSYSQGGDLPLTLSQPEYRDLPLRAKLEGVIPDPRSFDPIGLNKAAGLDPTSEEYARALTGRKDPMPEEMTARAMSLGDPLAGLAGPQDIQFFQPPPPEMDNSFMPISNDGGMDGGLENPFGAPEDVQRPSLSRDDIAGGIMPMAPGGYLGQGDGYESLKGLFNHGVRNKYNRDDIRKKQWSQDERDQNFGGWMMGLNNIASGFAGKSRGGRRFLDAQNQGYAQQAQNSRRMRGTEMGQQFDEDKYYGDLLNENDPNSIANQAKMMNAQTGIKNAEVAMRNAQSNEELRAARAEYLKQLDELKRAEEQGRWERAALKAEMDSMRIENQGRDIDSKIQDRSVRAAETSRHNKASESNIQSGQGVQMRGQDLSRQNTQDNIKSREKIAGIVDKRKAVDQQIAASKQGKDGPVVSAAGRAAAGIKLDPRVPEHRQKMIEYLARAGGDKRKALELAQADGW